MTWEGYRLSLWGADMAWEVGMEPMGRWGETANTWPMDCVPSSPSHTDTQGLQGL